MASMKDEKKLPVGSLLWIAEERASELKIAQEEAEDFAFCARNEAEWLNEHVADIFSENHLSVKDIFKTPGKLRGKTPRTVMKRHPLETRAPLTNIFAATSPQVQATPGMINFEKHRTPQFQVAKDVKPSPREDLPRPVQETVAAPLKIFYDSGYHGSQVVADASLMENDETAEMPGSPRQSSPRKRQVTQSRGEPRTMEEPDVMSVDEVEEVGERRTSEASFQSAHEDQVVPSNEETSPSDDAHDVSSPPRSPMAESIPEQSSPKRHALPVRHSPRTPLTKKPAIDPESAQSEAQAVPEDEPPGSGEADATYDENPFQSEESSPIRPVVRKSSLSFAALPAREPITTKTSIGNRISRTSHLDQNRQSYYGRPTGGKSLEAGILINAQQGSKKEDSTKMDLDNEVVAQNDPIPVEESDNESHILKLHHKTSTQRLQAQISRLGQGQAAAPRASKSIPNAAALSQPTYPSLSLQLRGELPSTKDPRPSALPGSFPEDEDESWIGPSQAAVAKTVVPLESSIPKGCSADTVNGAHAQDSDFVIPKQRENVASPSRRLAIPEPTASGFGHAKSDSRSQLKSPKKGTDERSGYPHAKGISFPNPSIPSGQNDVKQPSVPPASPTKSHRESPLKASKDKISSLLKFSKSLFASGAALSAEAKSSGLTPASKIVAKQPYVPHKSDVLTQVATDQDLYPTLAQVVDEPAPSSPSRPETERRTRASTEREEKRKEREAKEAQRMMAQLDKLEKAREKEQQKARVFSQEQAKAAVQAEQEKLAKESQISIPLATRTSPRKTKAQLEAEGRAAAALPASENEDEPIEVPVMPPPTMARTTMASQIGKPASLLKPPGRLVKEPAVKAKQAPTLFRVDMSTQRNQNLPSNSVLATSLQASLAPSAPPSRLKSKAKPSAASAKVSTNSFSSSMSSSTGPARPKALETAARKKEQDEREAQRKREIKLEHERKLDEKRQEQQRKKEVEKLREREREREQLDAKKASQAAKQALLKRKEVEMAKHQKAPPPAARPQTMESNGRSTALDKPLPPVPKRMNQPASRPASRMDNTRSQEELGRPISMGFHNTTKAPPKRPFQQDAPDEASRPVLQRNGPSYQQNDAKRRKTSDDFQETDMQESQARQMAPPIRQSGIRPKDGPSLNLFSNGYTHAPPISHPGSSLHKSTLQHLHQSKPAHPMDMAQVSKGNISFAGPSSQAVAGPSSLKTPARPAGGTVGGKSAVKSLAKSSPRYQNGDDINLPEIHTDSEDEDEEGEEEFAVPDWADSPALRDQLAAQDSIDPAEVFGPMPELKMEEIFKNKERWNRFRARTSSANWSGTDRLTDDEIRKDLEGRERLRREGGWTYGLS